MSVTCMMPHMSDHGPCYAICINHMPQKCVCTCDNNSPAGPPKTTYSSRQRQNISVCIVCIVVSLLSRRLEPFDAVEALYSIQDGPLGLSNNRNERRLAARFREPCVHPSSEYHQHPSTFLSLGKLDETAGREAHSCNPFRRSPSLDMAVTAMMVDRSRPSVRSRRRISCAAW